LFHAQRSDELIQEHRHTVPELLGGCCPSGPLRDLGPAPLDEFVAIVGQENMHHDGSLDVGLLHFAGGQLSRPHAAGSHAVSFVSESRGEIFLRRSRRDGPFSGNGYRPHFRVDTSYSLHVFLRGAITERLSAEQPSVATFRDWLLAQP
jgi:hypothetical protein